MLGSISGLRESNGTPIAQTRFSYLDLALQPWGASRPPNQDQSDLFLKPERDTKVKFACSR
jgi:hypothetical protein